MLPDPKPELKPKKTQRRAFTGFGAVLLFVLAFVLFFHFSFTTVIVSGSSMLPTLKNGKKVLVSRAYWLVGAVQDGNIVVIKGDSPGDYIIKRVYKMGGESVDMFNAPSNWLLANGEYKVPKGSVYVLGDNRSVSEDSRKIGPVELEKILGKVVAY
jgi:signal peptidase I